MMKIDLAELQKRIDEGLINKKKHPEHDIYIYNYSIGCQFDKKWDEYTRISRGLILDPYGYVISKPFEKFFNLNEMPESSIEKILKKGKPVITEKLDGSLGIMYFHKGDMGIATRGSFEGEQAVWATNWAKNNINLHEIKHSYTYLFEIIYPENRIVVDYGDRAELVLLAMISKVDGTEENYIEKHAEQIGVKYVKFYDFTLSEAIKLLPGLKGTEQEGFVAKFKDGSRVKLKADEYFLLHKTLNALSSVSIWECLKNNIEIGNLGINRYPELESWVKEVEGELRYQYFSVEITAKRIFNEIKDMETRKEQALYLKEHAPDLLGIVFNMIDHKSWNKLIWKKIKPETSKLKWIGGEK